MDLLLIVSPTPPVQSVDAYVRTLRQSRDNQKKRLTIFHEYGALSYGAPLLICFYFKNVEWTKDHDIQLAKEILVSEPYRLKPRTV